MDHIRVHEQREDDPKPDPRVYLRAAWIAFVCLGLVASLAWFLFVPPAIPPAERHPSAINGAYIVTTPDGDKMLIRIEKVSD